MDCGRMAMLVRPKRVGGVDDTGKGAKFSSIVATCANS